MIEFNDQKDRDQIIYLVNHDLKSPYFTDLFHDTVVKDRGRMISIVSKDVRTIGELDVDMTEFTNDVIRTISLIDLLKKHNLLLTYDNFLISKAPQTAENISNNIESQHGIIGIPDFLKRFTADQTQFVIQVLPLDFSRIMINYLNQNFYVTNELRDYVKNKFKTPEQIRFENERKDTNEKHGDAMVLAKAELKTAKQSVYISWVALAVTIILSVAIPFCADTTYTRTQSMH